MTETTDLERMLDVVVEKLETADEKLTVYVSKDKIGRAIGPGGSVVRAAELILGKPIEVKSVE
jgi:transcription antitermination factor NusA-like protein